MKVIQTARKERYLVFFLTVVLLSTIYPLFLGSLTGLISLYALISLSLVAGLYIIHDNYQWTLWSASLGFLTIISMWANLVFTEVKIIELIFTLSQLGFFALVTISIFTRVLGSQKITRETLLASASVYFLLAIVWAMLFELIELLQPGSFQITGQSEATISTDILIYLAQITLSSLGYGEIIPVTPLTRSLAALLAMTGQLYLTVLVAILIGIYLKTDKNIS